MNRLKSIVTILFYFLLGLDFQLVKGTTQPTRRDDSTNELIEKYKVSALPRIADQRLLEIESYAGKLGEEGESNNLFFWLARNTTNTKNKDKLVVWLNGGPGCTSLDGLFLENGPFEFDLMGNLVKREHSFTDQVDVLYIDQPIGTGYSRGGAGGKVDYARTYEEANTNLLRFLREFFRVFAEYKGREVVFSGESMAGTYLLYLARSLKETQEINVKGIMIGNGWMDSKRTYESYHTFIQQKDLVVKESLMEIQRLTNDCTKQYGSSKGPVTSDICESILNVLQYDNKVGEKKCYNVYDVRLISQKPECGMDWPPAINRMYKYVKDPQVQTALNLNTSDHVDWSECNNGVSEALSKDQTSNSAIGLIPEVLEAYPVLLFAGDQDLICNVLAHEWTIGNLTWNGDTGFSLPDSKPTMDSSTFSLKDYPLWLAGPEKNPIGTYHSERNLTYSIIYNASHMVGVDKPLEMLLLLSKFASLDSSNIAKYITSPRTIPTKTSVVSNGIILFLSFAILLAIILAIFYSSFSKLPFWKASSYTTLEDHAGSSDGRGEHEALELNVINPELYDNADFIYSHFVDPDSAHRLSDGTASSPSLDQYTE
ncbi:Pheromone-processing carboxypeptidase kex1 [Zancudomyces culisetae]|uniref:Pheromone-processing carboxypeptidase KEX1 n=1 Tax=Zancudomyces culisetae TaxID=1213189 RepID=A0A1R1PWB0_ZANCU|nr:Pheromone-processing carboxypeptidase kex1 [Zancudomyces culisetae]|eukprot:OMH85193.1 Pheromone-processing carboxypeptidase kex1 [Zancudomyces culisetae]